MTVKKLTVKKSLPFTFLALVIISSLVACSGARQASSSASLRVALVASFVSDESVEGFATYLKTGLPEYNDDEKSFSVVGISAGDPAGDPMIVMAGSTRIAAMLASREIELWISDPENAKKYADNGANYIALDELFSADEISLLGGTPIAIPVTDREGNTTGELSPIVGIDLSQNAAVAEMTGIRAPQMFVLAGSSNLEAAKAVFRLLAE
ncbi:MAG: hypothetical protein EA426_03630 [Spirochaetaceae bacterium]|nr:MAG: hypothetical protein EA426_03630 [Spirochaetaceae bacterium]